MRFFALLLVFFFISPSAGSGFIAIQEKHRPILLVGIVDIIKIRCVLSANDLAGRLVNKRWLHRIYLKQEGEQGSKCFKLIDVDSYYLLQCRTFRVRTTAEIAVGIVTLSDIQFGDESLCNKLAKPKTTLTCNFEHGDCGVENDACGLVGWEIRDDSEASIHFDPSLHCYKQTGVPLLIKKQISKICTIEHLNIAELQRSGFTTTSLPSKELDSSITSTKTKKRQTSGYALHLDPSHTTGVAIGILDLQEVEHDGANAFFTFYHDMGAGGLHDLLVTAVCTSDPARSLVPLDHGHLHYHKSNFDATGSSGIVCLDIHTYVDPNECSKFVIQMHAAAVLTTITIDNIFFANGPVYPHCSEIDNTPGY